MKRRDAEPGQGEPSDYGGPSDKVIANPLGHREQRLPVCQLSPESGKVARLYIPQSGIAGAKTVNSEANVLEKETRSCKPGGAICTEYI